MYHIAQFEDRSPRRGVQRASHREKLDTVVRRPSPARRLVGDNLETEAWVGFSGVRKRSGHGTPGP